MSGHVIVRGLRALGNAVSVEAASEAQTSPNNAAMLRRLAKACLNAADTIRDEDADIAARCYATTMEGN